MLVKKIRYQGLKGEEYITLLFLYLSIIMPQLTSPVGDLPENTRYAPFAVRMLASLMDIVLISVFILPIIHISEALLGLEYPIEQTQHVLQSGKVSYANIFYLLGLRLPSLLFEVTILHLVILFCWLKWSATLGKLFFGLKIVSAKTFEKPSLTQFIIRLLSYSLSTLPIGLGFLTMHFDKKNHAGWHDRLANTRVIQKKRQKKVGGN